MTFYSRAIIYGYTGSTIINNAELIQANRFVSDVAGTFNIKVPNDKGLYSGTFSVGDQVNIYLDSVNPPGSQIFRGNITMQQFTSTNDNREYLEIQGLDVSQNMQDVFAVNVYDNLPAGSIIKSLVAEYVSGMTVTNVQDGATVNHIGFNRRSVFDCVSELCDMNDYQYYVDNSADLHFEPKGLNDSGKTLSSGNCAFGRMDYDRKDMFNSVLVYGGLRTVRFQDTWTADGAGSVFTMSYKPTDPYVTVSGAVQIGWISELSDYAPSGTDYLHDYDNKKLIFVSGTSIGYSIPASGVQIIAQYGRKIPVVKMAEDSDSIDTYGRKQKVIVNEEIKDPRQARDLAVSVLEASKNPARIGIFRTVGEASFEPGYLVTLNFPYQGLNNESQRIVGVSYDITPETLQSEETTTVETSQRLRDVNDIIRDMIKRLKELEAMRIDPSDIITRIELSAGSFGLYDSWYARSRTIGSSFIPNHPVNGVIGSVGAGSLQPLIGFWGGAWTIQASGGNWT